jgi:hypothetical protein
MSTPNFASKSSQTAMLASDNSTLTRVEYWARMPPTDRSVLPLPTDRFS